MTSIDAAFARQLLRQVHADVRKHFPEANLQTAISGVGPHGRNQYFIQIDFGPERKLDVEVSAGSMTEAKANAWLRFLERNVPGYADGKAALDPKGAARAAKRFTAEQWAYLAELLDTEIECNENPTAKEIVALLRGGPQS